MRTFVYFALTAGEIVRGVVKAFDAYDARRMVTDHYGKVANLTVHSL